MRSLIWVACLWLATCATHPVVAQSLRIATFNVDATPPLGSPLCEAAVPPAKEIVDPLSARGIVLVGADRPIVLCSVDWVGIANASHDRWRAALAQAADTDVSHVSVHAIHQHDAPGMDESAEILLAARGMRGQICNFDAANRALESACDGLRQALHRLEPVTHVGVGSATVEHVASNRRILGDDGRVRYVRYSSCKEDDIRAAPEGTVDPLVRLVSFWQHDRPLAVLSYYATHPQSYYGQGGVSADFVGLARTLREKALPGVVLVHFNGASGNVAAGKYNDGSPAQRPLLAERLADGLRRAWEATSRSPLAAADVRWRTVRAPLPIRDTIQDEIALARVLDDPATPLPTRFRVARDLAYCQRVKAGHDPEIGCLSLGPGIRVLHLPGELFVEYQLAAQQMLPDATVCLAAYGDYGPGYIGTEISYSQGGYETGPASRTAPHVERVLMQAMAELLR